MLILQYASVFSIIAYTYALLLEPDEILDFLPEFYAKHLDFDGKAYKMLTCSKCFAGQLAFWVTPFLLYENNLFFIVAYLQTICFSIFIAHLLSKIIYFLEK